MSGKRQPASTLRSETRQFKVDGSERGITLIDYLADKAGLSKRQAKNLLDLKLVFVNRRRIWMAKHLLVTGDLVEFTLPHEATPPREKDIDILYRDPDFLVVNKPPGVITNQAEHSLEERLSRQVGPVLAVHRLDRETSGCVLFATSADAKEAMVHLFQERAVEKIYHAIVIGAFPSEVKTIRSPLDGKEAVTHVRILRVSPIASYLELVLETGRTHQIRRHLERVHTGLVGDKQYGGADVGPPILRTFTRHMLHAVSLGVKHPRETGSSAISCTEDRLKAVLQTKSNPPFVVPASAGIPGIAKVGNKSQMHPRETQPINVTAPLPDDFTECLRALGLEGKTAIKRGDGR